MPTRHRGAAATVSAALLTLAQAAFAFAGPGDTALVSRASGSRGEVANASAIDPAISSDGRYVAFVSEATNLDPADTDAMVDVYVRDLHAGATTLVSRASGAASEKSNGDSQDPAISGDGRFVAFTSTATNLDPADVDAGADVYLRDLATDTTMLVSRASGVLGEPGNGFSGPAALSANGQLVAFESSASNLDPSHDEGDRGQIYARNLSANTTRLVSRASGPSGPVANESSIYPSVSADGTRIAFGSPATNLGPPRVNVLGAVFVRDLATEKTSVASVASGGRRPRGVPTHTPEGLALSGNGRFVAFDSRAGDLVRNDRLPGTDVFVRDLEKKKTTLISRASGRRGDQADRWAEAPSISATGRYVAFLSRASNLDPKSKGSGRRLFIRDRAKDETHVVSGLRRSGATVNLRPKLSANGRFLAFESRVGLSPGDTNDQVDVYVRALKTR